MTNAMVFATCVRATAAVSVCRTIVRAIRNWSRLLLAPVLVPLGGFAKRADYIAVASSLSPPK